MFSTKSQAAAIASAVILSIGGGAYATAAATTTSGTAASAPSNPHEKPLTGETHRHGPGGHRGDPDGRGMDTAALATTLGVTETKLEAALEATRPARDDRDGKRTEHAAAIAKALGESTAAVQAVMDANRPDRGTGHEALITALAKKGAGDAAHDARHDAMAAALAKDLGIDAAKVEAALEANRPQRP